jgi:hypothetical protein
VQPSSGIPCSSVVDQVFHSFHNGRERRQTSINASIEGNINVFALSVRVNPVREPV